MAIEVKHGSDPAALAAVSFGGSQGATRSRLRTGMLSATEQHLGAERNREFSAEQAGIGRQFQSDQADASRQFSAEQAGIGRDFQVSQTESARQFGIDQAERSRAESMMDYSYDSQQQGQLDAHNKSYDDAVASGRNTPEELMQIKAHVDSQKANIRPREKFKVKQPYPPEQDVGKIFQQGDSYVVRLPNGDVKTVSKVADDPAMVQAKEAKEKKDDFVKRYRELASTEITDYVDEKDKDGKVIGQRPVKRRMTPDEIKDEIATEQSAISAYDNPAPAVADTVKVGSEIAEYGKKILGSVRPEEYRADAERVAKETGIAISDVFAMTRESLLGGDTSQISPAVANARTPYDVVKAIVSQGQAAKNDEVRVALQSVSENQLMEDAKKLSAKTGKPVEQILAVARQRISK